MIDPSPTRQGSGKTGDGSFSSIAGCLFPPGAVHAQPGEEHLAIVGEDASPL
jgi:hypothetical protein